MWNTTILLPFSISLFLSWVVDEKLRYFRADGLVGVGVEDVLRQVAAQRGLAAVLATAAVQRAAEHQATAILVMLGLMHVQAGLGCEAGVTPCTNNTTHRNVIARQKELRQVGFAIVTQTAI